MPHFAQINENNEVVQVLVVRQEYINTGRLGDPSKWIQTSYNTIGGKYYNADNSLGDQSKAFRGNYAVVGMTWDADKNAFIPEKPYNSWVLNETTFTWEPPVSKPEQTYTTINGTEYPDSFTWNESTTSWDKTEFSIKHISAEDDDLSLVNHLRV